MGGAALVNDISRRGNFGAAKQHSLFCLSLSDCVTDRRSFFDD